MDKFQFWLYIIIGVVYFLSRFRKKPEQKPKDLGDYTSSKPVQRYEPPVVKTGTSTVPKALTFEELLREITEGKKQERPAPTPAYVDYDDEIEEEEQDLEDVNYDHRKKDKAYEAYEEAKRQAFNRPSLEETMKLEDTVMRYGKFKEFEQVKERNLLAEYVAGFNDPEGFKKAVVMSEILKRKF